MSQDKKIAKLNQLLTYVCKENDFYSKFYIGVELPVNSIKNLPILQRSHIRECGNSIISNTYKNKKLKYDRTNGTTEGKPLEIYKTNTEWIALDLDLWNVRRSINKKAAKKYAFYYFNGDNYSEPYRLYTSGNRTTLQFPMCKKHEKDFLRDLQLMKEHKVQWIIGPPSIIFTLCCVSIKYKFSINVAVIESISEYLPAFYKRFFENVFCGKVYIHYSCHEVWGMGFTDKTGDLQIMDECIIQTQRDNRFKRDFGKCIVTNLRIKSMPFINYELSDLIKISGTKLQTFGFRWTEDVRLKQQTIHCSFFDNIFYEFKEINLMPLENYQIVFNENQITIYLIAMSENVCKSIKQYVSFKIKENFGCDICVNCVNTYRFFVDRISGKMRGIIDYKNVNWDGWEFSLVDEISKRYIEKIAN